MARMTAQGFDTDAVLTDSQIRRAVLAGYIAIGRYLKNLAPAEVASCAKYGMKLWLIDEGMGDRSTFERGNAGGQEDGARAAAQAKALGVPPGAVIYFAIDYDATVEDIDIITRYEAGYQTTCIPYRGGMYADPAIASAIPTPVGDYLPCAWKGEGPPDYANSGKVALMQHMPSALLGIDADPVDILDESVLWDPRGGSAQNSPPATVTPPATDPTPPLAALPDLATAQAFLKAKGLYIGEVDGRPGPLSAAAFALYYGWGGNQC